MKVNFSLFCLLALKFNSPSFKLTDQLLHEYTPSGNVPMRRLSYSSSLVADRRGKDAAAGTPGYSYYIYSMLLVCHHLHQIGIMYNQRFTEAQKLRNFQLIPGHCPSIQPQI